METKTDDDRVTTLAGYGILDTPAETGFDDIVLLASQICRTPTALVSLVERDRQWFKARIGFDCAQTPMSQSVCVHALRGDGILVIPDLTADPRTFENSLVTGPPHIRFYAGAVLETPEGVRLGSLCVIDTVPRPLGLTPVQTTGLQALARQVMTHLALRKLLLQRDSDSALMLLAKNEAEDANKAKSLFLTNMSHELRTPLSAVIGYAEMLEEEAEEFELPSLVSDLGKIKSSAQHLLSMINDLLDLSKIEADKMDVVVEEADVAAMIHDVESTVIGLVEKKGNTLVLDLQEELGSMRTDVTKVKQCLFNLVGNAAKFSENERIVLSVARDTETDELVFSVTDSGIGMTPEQIGRMFQRFSQADGSISQRFGGTGLGLALTKSFCVLLGGDIAVESTMGTGTRFTMRFPPNKPMEGPVEP